MKLQYTRDELLADHEYAAPHVVGDYRLHGGFDADGTEVLEELEALTDPGAFE